MDDGGNFAAFEAEACAVGDGAAAMGDGVRGVVGDGSGPELEVFAEGFRPVDGEAGGGVLDGRDGSVP